MPRCGLYGNLVPGSGGGGEPVTPEQIEAAVNKYLAENPVQAGATEEQAAQIEQNKNDIEIINVDFQELTKNMQYVETVNLFDESWSDGYMSPQGTINSGNYKYKRFEVQEGDVFYAYITSESGVLEKYVGGGIRFVCARGTDEIAIPSSGSNIAIDQYTVPSGIKYIEISVRNTITCVTKNKDYIGYPFIKPESPSYKATEKFLDGVNIEIGKPTETFCFGGDVLSVKKDNFSVGDNIILSSNSVKKNKILVFNANVNSFNSVKIGHGKQSYGGNYVVIDKTYITVYKYEFAETQVVKEEHSIPTFLNNITIIIDCKIGVADIIIISDGNVYKKENVIWNGTSGEIFAESLESEFSGCVLSWCSKDIRKNTWIFGDSYVSLSSERWVSHLIEIVGDNILISGYPGEISENAYEDLIELSKIGTPKNIVWCLGMNDPDRDSAINPAYYETAIKVKTFCELNNVNLILATIPNTETLDHTYKNQWIKSTGIRYIDFAQCLGAESFPSGWFDGMMGSDNIHPNEFGAKTMAGKAISDFVEITR